MKRKENFKLDVLSNIDEKIIDEVTDRRIALIKQTRRVVLATRKRLIAICSAAASFLLLFGFFITVLLPLLNADVPVYRGMTVRRESSLSLEVDGTNALEKRVARLHAKHDSISRNRKYDSQEQTETPEKDIEDLVRVDVVTDDVVKYYVEPGETFMLEVHISNPENYEIQSFTLNGKKYANYMFEQGSTMELLLLEVTAPETPGYVEYTIDAIKYIDGTRIKNVDMSKGDKSVKVGIAYSDTPIATVNMQSISATSVELVVDVLDNDSVIGDGELSIYLSDGKKIVDQKPLKAGKNTVTFSELLASKTYEYGVMAVFDLADGRDLHAEWLLKNTVKTIGIFGISNVASTKNSIFFEVDQFAGSGTITTVSLSTMPSRMNLSREGELIQEYLPIYSPIAVMTCISISYTP